MHGVGRCKDEAEWYVEMHLVDKCKDRQTATATFILCQFCFAALVDNSKWIVGKALEGVRSPLCKGCFGPLVKLSHIIRDVARI